MPWVRSWVRSGTGGVVVVDVVAGAIAFGSTGWGSGSGRVVVVEADVVFVVPVVLRAVSVVWLLEYDA